MPGGRSATRRGSVLIAVAVAALMATVWFLAPTMLTRVDLALYDQHFRWRGARAGHAQVAIVAIDEASLRAIGRWPWPRRILAELIERVDEAGAAAIGIDVILNEPERSGELEAATRIAQRVRAVGGPPALLRELDAIVHAADNDRLLAEAIAASGRVVLASLFTLSAEPPPQVPARTGQPLKSAIVSFKRYDDRGVHPPVNADSAGLPIPALLRTASGLGHVNMVSDSDGTTRWEALVVEYAGHYYPSLALETVRVAAGLDPIEVTLDFGNTLALGDLEIPIDPRARVLVGYAGPGHSFPHYSAIDVLSGRIPPQRLRDRIVFVGATAEGTYDLRVTPFSPVLPGVEKHANVAGNLLDGEFLVRPAFVELYEATATVVLPFVLAWLLPRLRPVPSLGAVLALAAAVAGGAHVAFRHGLWMPAVYPVLAIALAFVGITVLRFVTEERQRRWTKRAFQQYVSPEVVDRIVEDPRALQFGGEVRNLTVLFVDIRDFTGLTERHDPHELVAMLREHFTRLTNCVLQEGGTLDKYIGDALMAIFGAPVAVPDHAERACRAAWTMVDAAERLQAKWERAGREPFRIGIGINTGEMLVGNLGSEQVFTYTAVGDEVNLGARLEALNKDHRTTRPIILSESTYEAARGAIEARPLGEVKVRGKTRPVVIYEMTGLARAAAVPASARRGRRRATPG
jgi:adenylate cyclase